MALTALDAVAGGNEIVFSKPGGVGPYDIDNKTQITVRSQIPMDLSCVSLMNHLAVEVIGPLPTSHLVATGKFNKIGKSTLITLAKRGTYDLTLIDSKGDRKIQSIAFRSTIDDDRFNLYFQTCTKAPRRR